MSPEWIRSIQRAGFELETPDRTSNRTPNGRLNRFKRGLDKKRRQFWASLPFAVFGFGIDAMTEAAGNAGTLTIPKLSSLGVLSPDEVDRICAEQSGAQFLIEDFLPAGSIAIAAGESTIGKSALFCQLSLCVAGGVPFLGMPTKQGRVLYFDLENSLPDCKGMRDSLVRFLGLGKAPEDFLLMQDPAGNLEALLEVVRPRLVIIDSLRAFRPDVTERNAVAGEWLKEIRKQARKYECTFLIIHHLRKPNENVALPNLGDCNVATWLYSMEGPRAFVNQTDVRIAIAGGDGDPAALQIKWSRRVHGDSPLVFLERIFDENDEPVGYRHMIGASLLSSDRRSALDKLPAEFSTKDAKFALCRSDQPTNNFLVECKELDLIEKLGRGRWRKMPPTEARVWTNGAHSADEAAK